MEILQSVKNQKISKWHAGMTGFYNRGKMQQMEEQEIEDKELRDKVWQKIMREAKLEKQAELERKLEEEAKNPKAKIEKISSKSGSDEEPKSMSES